MKKSILKMIYVELDFKCRHMNWSEFKWDGVGRNSCQKKPPKKTNRTPRYFISSSGVFIFENTMNQQVRVIASLYCILSSIWKKHSWTYLHPFREWSNKQKIISLVTSKEPREKNTDNSLKLDLNSLWMRKKSKNKKLTNVTLQTV